MTRICVLPHHTTTDGIDAGAWTVNVGPAEIEVRSEVTIDVERVRAACGLVEADPLLLIATWHSSGTNIRRVGLRGPVERSTTHPIGFAIDRTLVAGHVTLVRCVALGEATGRGDDLAAQTFGAVLWREPPREATTFGLDDAAARMATEAVDFDRLTEGEPDAAWRLDVDFSDLEAPPSASLRLSVNTAHPAIDQLLSGVDDDSNTATESVLRWDIARQIVEHALDCDAFVEGFGEFSSDTVGGAMQGLVERWLAGASPRELRTMRSRDRPSFEGLLQHRFELLQVP